MSAASMQMTENLKGRTCTKHEKRLKLFCKTDQMYICRLCTVLGHKNHDVVPLTAHLLHLTRSEKKICLVVMGREGALKNALITNILGKDLEIKTSVLKKTEIYENSMFIVIRTPDGKISIDDTRDVFLYRNPDMSLLVVKDGFSPEDVREQLDQLHKITGKPTEEFTVLLPLGHEPGPDSFRWRTMGELFNELSMMMSEGRGLMAAGESRAGPAASGEQNPSGEQDSSHSRPDQAGSEESFPQQSLPAPLPRRPIQQNIPAYAGNHHASRVNLVLLGMSGVGKSATGNTILGQNIFRSRPSSKPVTKECQAEEAELGARRVCVVDTPDIFDDDINSSTKAGDVRRCKELCQDGPTVFLLVMHVSRFTDGERGVLKELQDAFGQRAHEKTIILFTRGDDLRQEDMSFKEFLRSCHPDLKNIVATCGYRCVLFENKDTHTRQVQNLMKIVDSMIK